jgi:hypothetical protein
VDQHPHAGVGLCADRDELGEERRFGTADVEAVAGTAMALLDGTGARLWLDVSTYCSDFGLRLPSFSEARAMARNYDVPGLSGQQLVRRDSLYPTELSGLLALLQALRTMPRRDIRSMARQWRIRIAC